jgi:hypothetical protein
MALAAVVVMVISQVVVVVLNHVMTVVVLVVATATAVTAVVHALTAASVLASTVMQHHANPMAMQADQSFPVLISTVQKDQLATVHALLVTVLTMAVIATVASAQQMLAHLTVALVTV